MKYISEKNGGIICTVKVSLRGYEEYNEEYGNRYMNTGLWGYEGYLFSVPKGSTCMKIKKDFN